jgi:hypothetical protein
MACPRIGTTCGGGGTKTNWVVLPSCCGINRASVVQRNGAWRVQTLDDAVLVDLILGKREVEVRTASSRLSGRWELGKKGRTLFRGRFRRFGMGGFFF